MGVDTSKLTLVRTYFIGIETKKVPIKGSLNLLMTIRTYPKCHALQQTFMVIKMNLSYNVIHGRPLIHKINAVINNRYPTMKFPTDKEVAIVRESKLISRRCTLTYLKGNKICVGNIQHP